MLKTMLFSRKRRVLCVTKYNINQVDIFIIEIYSS